VAENTAVLLIFFFFHRSDPDPALALMSDPNSDSATFKKDSRLHLIFLKAQDHLNFVFEKFTVIILYASLML
jgi:hypothetical protein